MIPGSYTGGPVDRSAIKNALLALAVAVAFPYPVNGASSWALPPSRRLILWNQCPIQPRCFLVQHREGYQTHGTGRLTRRWLECGFWCYAQSGDATSGVLGDEYLDAMEYGLEQALAPDDPGRGELTLGGLVYWARIDRVDGLFVRDPGDIDGQALLVLPVRILLP